MNNRQERLILAANEAIVFARDLKNAPSRVTQAGQRLQKALDVVFEARMGQLNAKNYGTVPRQSIISAKTTLVKKHLHPIAADGLEMFAGLPGIKETLKVPRIKSAPEAHLKAAERVRRVAEAHEAEFINERDYSENFLEQFDKAVRDLEAAAQVDRGAARAKYTRATADVETEIARVRLAFDALDTRIVEAYMGDQPTLALWRRASRIPAKTGRPRKRKKRE